MTRHQTYQPLNNEELSNISSLEPVQAEPVNQRASIIIDVSRIILMVSIVFLTAACTCCVASKAINGTFIPNLPKYKFEMNIQLSEEEKEDLQKGKAKLELSLGNQSVKFVIPPNQIWYDGNVGHVAGRVKSQPIW